MMNDITRLVQYLAARASAGDSEAALHLQESLKGARVELATAQAMKSSMGRPRKRGKGKAERAEARVLAAMKPGKRYTLEAISDLNPDIQRTSLTSHLSRLCRGERILRTARGEYVRPLQDDPAIFSIFDALLFYMKPIAEKEVVRDEHEQAALDTLVRMKIAKRSIVSGESHVIIPEETRRAHGMD